MTRVRRRHARRGDTVMPDPGAGDVQVTTPDFDFLVVDEFLRTLVDLRALKTAFELGLVDRLLEHRGGDTEALGRALGVDPQGFHLLLDLLAANRVVERHGGDVRLGRRFLAALRYRDLLQAKLDFAGFTLGDFAELFTLLVTNGDGFQRQAGLFQLFDYRRCLEFSPENYARTRGWMRITSALTRYEVLACLPQHDFSRHRRLLDVGGNSGEFVLQLCRRHPGLRGTVLDLPLVCEIGLEHVLAEPEQDRIGFVKADVRTDRLPPGHDLISFKSMLHDWPWPQACGFIARAAEALAPGGTLLIFERAALALEQTPPVSMLPHLLFFRSYRRAADYVEALQALGFEDIRQAAVALDSPFFVVTGRKPAG